MPAFRKTLSISAKEFLVSRIAAHLDVGDGVPVEAGRFRELPNGPIQRGARHSYLCICHRHIIVPLSHVSLSHGSISADKRGGSQWKLD